MNAYIRKNDEGENVVDYDLLDMASRTSFQQYVERWAAMIEVDIVSEPDASKAEKLEAINGAAHHEMLIATQSIYDDDGEEVEVDQDTQVWIVDVLVGELEEKYAKQLS